MLFLTRVLWDDSGLELFVSHGWQQVVGVQEVVYKELCWEFFLTILFEKALMRWADRSMFTLRLGGVSRSSNLNELGRRLGIYTTEETMSPHFCAYLDSCITTPPQEYSHMQFWVHARETYVSRKAKESTFRSPIYRLIYRLVDATIYHCQECDNVPSGDLFYTWYLTQTKACLYLLFALAL